jgi:hypothetical protein
VVFHDNSSISLQHRLITLHGIFESFASFIFFYTQGNVYDKRALSKALTSFSDTCMHVLFPITTTRAFLFFYLHYINLGFGLFLSYIT